MARRYTIGGKEWAKWCAEETPLRMFLKGQRADRVDRREKIANKDMKEDM